MPTVIKKIKELKDVLKKAAAPSNDNPSPHLLDTQPSFVTTCNSIKENLTQITYQAEQANKRGFIALRTNAKSTKSKLDLQIGSLTGYTRLMSNLVYTHNQNVLAQEAANQSSSTIAAEIQNRMKIAQNQEKKTDAQFQLGQAIANKFKGGSSVQQQSQASLNQTDVVATTNDEALLRERLNDLEEKLIKKYSGNQTFLVQLCQQFTALGQVKAYLDIQENKNDFPISRSGPFYGRAPFLLNDESHQSASSLPLWKKDSKGRIITQEDPKSKKRKEERESTLFERDHDAPVELYDDKSTQKQQSLETKAEELNDTILEQIQLSDAQAQCLEAHCLLNGHGIGQHVDDALQWYRNSVDKNEPKAMLALGQMYENGIGMQIDKKKAQEYFQRAAEIGEPISQLKFARVIIQGKHRESTSEGVIAPLSANTPISKSLKQKNSVDSS